MFDASKVFILLVVEPVEITSKKDTFPWSNYDKWGEKLYTWNVVYCTASILIDFMTTYWRTKLKLSSFVNVRHYEWQLISLSNDIINNQ